MKKQMAILTAAVLTVCSTVGCSQQEASADLTPVRLNEVVHSVFYAPQYVAQELGFFEEEGLDVTVSVGNGADKSMTALLSDSADIALLGTEAGRRQRSLSQSLCTADTKSREFPGIPHTFS